MRRPYGDLSNPVVVLEGVFPYLTPAELRSLLDAIRTVYPPPNPEGRLHHRCLRARIRSAKVNRHAPERTPIDVRPAAPADLDPLARLWYDGWQDAHLGVLPPELARRRTLDSFRERLRAALPSLRVVGPPAAPLGFCLVHSDELDQLYVSAASRGTGAAVALIEDAEDRMRNAGIETAWLACAVGNERAARFYEKRGWHRAGTVMHEPDDSGGIVFEVWRYEKSLRSWPGADRH